MPADAPWSVRIGVSPIAWSNDDLPELGGATPLETCLSDAHEAGYEGIELGSKFPRNPQELSPIIARYGLELVSGWYGSRLREQSVEAELESLHGHIGLLRAMGATVVVFAEVSGAIHGQPDKPLSRRPVLDERDWAGFTEKLNTVAKHLESQGLAMAYHHHMGTVVETAEEIDRLMAETEDAVGLLIDTGHLAFADVDPLVVTDRHGARVRHVHCKDVRRALLDQARHDDASFLDAVRAGVFTVPGDGHIDFAAVFEVLRRVGYQGWLVVEAEQDPAKADPLTYARKGYVNLRRAISESAK